MKITNCGLDALEKIGTLKNVSAFTLFHLARDNGLNLHIFKTDIDKLPLVKRPAIFHQEDHFVFVKNGEAMPAGKYTGYVLGAGVMGRLVPLVEAKLIKGGKKGGFFRQIVAPVVAIASTVAGAILGGPAGAATGFKVGIGLGAASNAGMNTYAQAQHPEQLGKPSVLGTLGQAAIGGLEAFGAGKLATGAIAAATPSVAAGAVPSSAASTASFNAAHAAGFAGVPASSAAGFASGVNAALPASTGFGGAGALAAGVGSQTTPSIFSGANATPGAIATGSATNSSLLSKVGTAIDKNPVGAAATGIGAIGMLGSKSPQFEGAAPQDNYSTIKTFFGDTNQLPQATQADLLKTIQTPLSELQTQMSTGNDRVISGINVSYDNQKQNIIHQYAQAGQNMSNSSELQQKVNELEQKRTQDITLANQELRDQNLNRAIQVKQQALSNAMAQGQWNDQLAMELAGQIGQQDTLRYAIQHNDYQTFQTVMGQIMAMGVQSFAPKTSTGGININLGGK